MNKSEIEITKKQEPTLLSMISSPKMKEQWELVMTKYLTPERLSRIAISQLKRTPKLAECNATSVLNALMTCAELEMEPDGRRIHLIPYKNQCQLIVDYKGLIELARRSGEISNIYADIICDNDEFEWNLGQVEKHKIDIRTDRGKVIGAYARMLFKDGTVQCELMSKADIDAIKGRSKASSFGPWISDYNEMAKKTVLRRLLKTAPMGSKESIALQNDQDAPDFEKERKEMKRVNSLEFEDVNA